MDMLTRHLLLPTRVVALEGFHHAPPPWRDHHRIDNVKRTDPYAPVLTPEPSQTDKNDKKFNFTSLSGGLFNFALAIAVVSSAIALAIFATGGVLIARYPPPGLHHSLSSWRIGLLAARHSPPSGRGGGS